MSCNRIDGIDTAYRHGTGSIASPGAHLRQVGGIALGSDCDALAVDDDRVTLGLNLAGKTAVNRVALEQPGIALGVRKVVDRDQLQTAIRPLEDRSGDQPADAAEPVDGDFGHRGFVSHVRIDQVPLPCSDHCGTVPAACEQKGVEAT